MITTPELKNAAFGLPSAEESGVKLAAALHAPDIAAMRAMDAGTLSLAAPAAGYAPWGTIDGHTAAAPTGGCIRQGRTSARAAARRLQQWRDPLVKDPCPASCRECCRVRSHHSRPLWRPGRRIPAALSQHQHGGEHPGHDARRPVRLDCGETGQKTDRAGAAIFPLLL